MQSEFLISTDNPNFIEKVESRLRQGESIVILLRYSSQGGNRDYFLVRSVDEFHRVLRKAHRRDAISVFFSQSFPVQGMISGELKDKIVGFLNKTIRDDDEEAILLIRLDTNQFMLGNDDMKVFFELSQVEEWCSKNIGVPVLVGILAFWENNSESMLTAYVRDSDGRIRRGAY